MTLNLETNLRRQIDALDPVKWTALQTKLCMAVANAKLHEFDAQAHRLAELVRFKLISRTEAADMLHVASVYNQLPFEYGRDAIQRIMADAFREAVEC